MTTKLISTGSELVTATDVKTACRITTTATDALIAGMIKAAREAAEHETSRALCEQNWRISLDEFPDAIELAHPPIRAITSVKYYDADGVLTTLSSASYQLDAESEPGWVVPAVDYTWPSTQLRANAVEVIYTCGYTAETLPESIKQWMYLQIRAWYDQPLESAREPVKSSFADALLDRYRIYR